MLTNFFFSRKGKLIPNKAHNDRYNLMVLILYELKYKTVFPRKKSEIYTLIILIAVAAYSYLNMLNTK